MKRILAGTMVAMLSWQAEGRLPIEKLQREIQIRHMHSTQATEIDGRIVFNADLPINPAHHLIWAPTMCSAMPPDFPPDKFYGEVLRPDEEAFLVQDVLDKLNASQIWTFYVSVDGEYQTTPLERPGFLDTPCTTNNLQDQFDALQGFVSSLDTVRARPGIITAGGPMWHLIYEGDANSSNQEAHSNNYVTLLDQIYSGSGTGEFPDDDYYPYPSTCGYVWEYRQWTNWQDWENYLDFYGIEHGETNPDAAHFTQVAFRQALSFRQPDFDVASIHSVQADVIVQIESLEGMDACPPTGYTPADLGLLKRHATLGRGETSPPVETLREGVPEPADPMEAASPRRLGWFLNTNSTYSIVKLEYKPLVEDNSRCAGCQVNPGGLDANLSSMHVAIGLGADESGNSAGVLELAALRQIEGIAALSRVRFQALMDGVQAEFTNGIIQSVTAPQCRTLITALNVPRTNGGFMVNTFMRPDPAAMFESAPSRQIVVVQGMQDPAVAAAWLSGDFSNPGEYWDDSVHVFEFCEGNLAKQTHFEIPYHVRKVNIHPPETKGVDADVRCFLVQRNGELTAVRMEPSASKSQSPIQENTNGAERLARKDAENYAWDMWHMYVENNHGAFARTYDRIVNGTTATVRRGSADHVFHQIEDSTDTYVEHPWGWSLMRTEACPWDNPIWTDYAYVSNAAENGYGQLKELVHSDGRWERYEYDAAGERVKTISPFNDAPPGSAEDLCRVQTMETQTTGNETTVAKVEKVLGVEIARSYSVETPTQSRHVLCGSPDATIDDPGNLVSVTTYEQRPGDDSPFTGRRAVRVEHADGTLTLRTYPDDQTEIEWRGEPNPDRTQVVDGTRAETIKNGFGHVVSRRVYDISSGVLTDSEIAIEFDGMGRPIAWSHLDGTTRRIDPGCCCGIASETGRDGSVRSFEYDPQGNPVLTIAADAEGDEIIERAVYDAAGRLRMKGYSDPIGMGLKPWDHGFNDHFMLLERQDYDTAGRLRAEENMLGGQTIHGLLQPDGLHQVQTTTLPDGGTVVEEYQVDGELFRRTGTAAPHVQMEYGLENGEQFTKTIRLGENGEATLWSKTFTDFLGRTYKTEYSDGSSEQSWFNSKGQEIKTVDREGIITLYEYNGRGERETVAIDGNRNGVIDCAGEDRIVRTRTAVVPGPAGSVRRTTMQAWDQMGMDHSLTTEIRDVSVDGLNAWTVLNGQTTHVATVYSPAETNREETVTYSDQTRLITTFRNGQMVRQDWRDANDASTRTIHYTYGDFGDLVRQDDTWTGMVDTTYLGPHLPASRIRYSQTDAQDMRTESFSFDNSMRLVAVTNADNSVMQYAYASNGLVRMQQGAGTYPVEYVYDVQGRVTQLRTWQDFAATSGMATTAWIYDPTNGALARKEYADGNGVSYGYTPGGRIKTRTWARGSATEYSYNSFGDLANVQYLAADAPDTAYGYDRLGRMTSASNSHAHFQYGYEGMLLRTETMVAMDCTNILSRQYDDLNRNAGVRLNGAGIAGYRYDEAGRMTKVSFADLTNSYAYGPNGQISAAAMPGRLSVDKSYNGFGQLAALTNSTSAGLVSGFAYDHDLAGRRTALRMQMGQEDSVAWIYEYDSLGQLTRAQKTAQGEVLAGRDYGYAYDSVGNRRWTSRGGGSVPPELPAPGVVLSEYSANLLNQYTSRTVPAVAEISGTGRVDAVLSFQNLETGERIRAARNGTWFHADMPLADNSAGSVTNRIRATGVLPGQGSSGADLIHTNEVLTLAAMQTPQAFTYDDDGNLLRDGQYVYSWDGENRLVGVSNENMQIHFAYDHMGRRIRRTSTSGTTNTYVYDGWNPVADICATASGVSTNIYVWGLDLSGTLQGAGGIGGLLAIVEDGERHLVALDGNGNVVNLVDAATGQVSATYEYGPFGEVLRATGPEAADNPWRFSTRYSDMDAGLLLYPKRVYSPALGRFLSRDPRAEIDISGSEEDLFPYCRNDPVNYLDPDGERGQSFDRKNKPRPETAYTKFPPSGTNVAFPKSGIWMCQEELVGRRVLGFPLGFLHHRFIVIEGQGYGYERAPGSGLFGDPGRVRDEDELRPVRRDVRCFELKCLQLDCALRIKDEIVQQAEGTRYQLGWRDCQSWANTFAYRAYQECEDPCCQEKKPKRHYIKRTGW